MTARHEKYSFEWRFIQANWAVPRVGFVLENIHELSVHVVRLAIDVRAHFYATRALFANHMAAHSGYGTANRLLQVASTTDSRKAIPAFQAEMIEMAA